MHRDSKYVAKELHWWWYLLTRNKRPRAKRGSRKVLCAACGLLLSAVIPLIAADFLGIQAVSNLVLQGGPTDSGPLALDS